MNNVDLLFNRLSKSTFRQKFKLGPKERQYCIDKGPDTIDQHALDFIQKRLAAEEPKNDGKQTPMRGHPVFIAQHATATCCRGCLKTWHGIEKHRQFTEEEQTYIVQIIHRWLVNQMNS